MSGALKHEGRFVNGKREGLGIETVSSTSREGLWQNDLPCDGDWLINYKNGSKYSGRCVGGKPDGLGVIRYGNDDVYSGYFRQGLRHGDGVIIFGGEEGQWEGRFVNGKLYDVLWGVQCVVTS